MRKIATGLLLMAFTTTAIAEEADAPPITTDFIRDVMMPIGIPVVSSFHAIRESLFLNATRKNPNPLEAVGNFLLIPSRYLFAGKKIKIKETNSPECEVIQSFSYRKMHWLKTTGAIAALPVSHILGSTLKGLSFLSPDVRRKHRLIKKALKTTHIHSHVEEYQLKGLSELHTEDYIPCQHHSRPSHLTKNQKIEIQALDEIVELLEKHQIVYWLDCGSCLGAYRYGGMIPWDWDIDISIFVTDHDNVKKLLSTLDPKKYQIQDWSSYSKPKTFLKLYVKETKNFIDIYHYQINEAEKTVGYVFTYMDSPFPHSWKKAELKCITPLKYEEMFPLKKAKFDTLTLRAPNHVVKFLQSKYGENLDPAKVWDEESKAYKKVENHPYYD